MTMGRLSRGLAWVGALLLAAVLAAWWIRSSSPPAEAVMPPALRQAAMPHDVSTIAPVPAPASPATPSDAAARLADDDPRCRITEAEASRASSPSPERAVARDQLLQRLGRSPDPYARAVAVWVQRPKSPEGLAERARQLAALAASTTDPRLYSLALRTCWRVQGDNPSCPSLSARRWSELEPDNAMPWLMMMDEAKAHQDLSGFQEALYHAANAKVLAERPAAPVVAIVDAAGDDPASMAAAQELAIEAIGISAATPGPTAMSWCHLATPADANLWQQCTALGDLLQQRSDTLTARLAGASIHRRQTRDTVPSDRVIAQMGLMSERLPATTSGCRDLRDHLATLRRLGLEGDVALVQDLAP